MQQCAGKIHQEFHSPGNLSSLNCTEMAPPLQQHCLHHGVQTAVIPLDTLQ